MEEFVDNHAGQFDTRSSLSRFDSSGSSKKPRLEKAMAGRT